MKAAVTHRLARKPVPPEVIRKLRAQSLLTQALSRMMTLVNSPWLNSLIRKPQCVFTKDGCSFLFFKTQVSNVLFWGKLRKLKGKLKGGVKRPIVKAWLKHTSFIFFCLFSKVESYYSCTLFINYSVVRKGFWRTDIRLRGAEVTQSGCGYWSCCRPG